MSDWTNAVKVRKGYFGACREGPLGQRWRQQQHQQQQQQPVTSELQSFLKFLMRLFTTENCQFVFFKHLCILYTYLYIAGKKECDNFVVASSVFFMFFLSVSSNLNCFFFWMMTANRCYSAVPTITSFSFTFLL